MARILVLQGCMAAGKSTAADYIRKRRPDIYVDYENPRPVFAEATRRGLGQNTPEGFVETQRLFIAAEIERYAGNSGRECVLYDLGAEEIEFYTLFYPKSLGFDWDTETWLKPELTELRRLRADAVLYLDASKNTLSQRKEADINKRRGFFEHFITHMADDKRRWFAERKNPKTDFISVDGINAEQTGAAVLEWINTQLCH